MIDSQIDQLFQLTRQQSDLLSDIRGGVNLTNGALDEVYSSVVTVQDAVAGTSTTRSDRVLLSIRDELTKIHLDNASNTDRITQALESNRNEVQALSTSSTDTVNHLQALSRATDAGNVTLGAISQVMDSLRTQGLASSAISSESTAQGFSDTQDILREINSDVRDLNRDLTHQLTDATKQIVDSIDRIRGTGTVVIDNLDTINESIYNNNNVNNPRPPSSPGNPNGGSGDGPNLDSIMDSDLYDGAVDRGSDPFGLASVISAIKGSLPYMIATAVGGAIISSFNKLDRLTGEASSIFMTSLGQTREESFKTYQDILVQSRDIQKEMANNPFLGYKISVDEWEEAMKSAVGATVRGQEKIAAASKTLAITSKILPEVNIADLGMFKRVVEGYTDGAERMMQVSTLARKYSQSMWVDPGTIMQVADEYTTFVKSVSSDSDAYVRNMNKMMKATAALEDNMLDAAEMIGRSLEKAFTPLSELDTTEYTKNAMLGIDTLEYRRLMQTGQVDEAMALQTKAIQDRFSRYKNADGSFNVTEQFLQEASLAGLDPQQVMSIVSGNKGDGVIQSLEQASQIGDSIAGDLGVANDTAMNTLRDNVYVSTADQVKNAVGTEVRLLAPLQSINDWMATLNEKTLPQLLLPIGLGIAGLVVAFKSFNKLKDIIGGRSGRGGLLGSLTSAIGGRDCCCEGIGAGVLGGKGRVGGVGGRGGGAMAGGAMMLGGALDVASTVADVADMRANPGIPTPGGAGTAKPGTTPTTAPVPKQGFFGRMKGGFGNIAADFKGARAGGGGLLHASQAALAGFKDRRATAKLNAGPSASVADKMKGALSKTVESTKSFSANMVDKTKGVLGKAPTPPTGATSAASGAAGAASGVGKVANVLSKAAVPLTVAMGALNIATADDKVKATGETAGGIAGSMAGAAAGAAIGSVVPVIGTAIGGIIGGIAGGLGGSSLGGKIVDWFRGGKTEDEAKPSDPTQPTTTPAELTPEQQAKADFYNNPTMAGMNVGTAETQQIWENGVTSDLGSSQVIANALGQHTSTSIPGPDFDTTTIVRDATATLDPTVLEYSAYADGGVINKPHFGLVGEDGPEVIIPLSSNKRDRALGLWDYTGSKLGADTSSPVHEAESQSKSSELRNASTSSERVDSGAIVTSIETLTSVMSAKMDRLIKLGEASAQSKKDDRDRPHSPMEPGVLTAGARDVRNFL